jgi:hypothetical protein
MAADRVVFPRRVRPWPGGKVFTDEEVAFCDALAEHDSARQVMGRPNGSRL